MKVNEIFYSIEGEGIRAGAPAAFIRFSGCNLRCSYCDTAYAFYDGKEMSEDDIVKKVCEIGCKNITVTGGEPLLQGIGVIRTLCEKGFNVNIETNGSIDIESVQLENSIVTMDYKTPSSNMEHKMLLSNIHKLRECDVLKFVCTEKDFDVIRDIYNTSYPACTIFLSPVFERCSLVKLADFVKEINDSRVRVQMQLHKIIWKPDERGV